jgi:hypothetical protein
MKLKRVWVMGHVIGSVTHQSVMIDTYNTGRGHTHLLSYNNITLEY